LLTSRPIMKFGSISVTGRVRFANEDAVCCAEEMGLFVVADGLGGHPAGEVASQVAAHGLPRVVVSALNHPAIPEDVPLGALLRDAMILLNRHLNKASATVASLQGMGATIVSLIFERQIGHIVHAGDSRAYLFRNRQLKPMTQDHHEKGLMTMANETVNEGSGRITQFMSMPGEVAPDIVSINLKTGDRLLLCTDGLTGPLDMKAISEILSSEADPQRACETLADAANNNGGPDNITCIIVDWLGFHKGRYDIPTDPSESDAQPLGDMRNSFRQGLLQLEKGLSWLVTGAREVAHPSPDWAKSAAQRLVGEQVFNDYIAQHPHDPPLTAFHRICTSPDGSWRKAYDDHRKTFDPLLETILAGNLRISPMLSPKTSAEIFKKLWYGWTHVEQRYFTTCSRQDLNRSEKAGDLLYLLVEHLAETVRDLRGLFEMLPMMAIHLDSNAQQSPQQPPAPSDPSAETAELTG